MKRRPGVLLVIGAFMTTLSPLVTARTNPYEIQVETVDELYAAVNDSGNSQVTINLVPRTYVLSVQDSQGHPRPNGGALRLQPGMSLVGAEQRVDWNGDGVPDPVSPASPDDFTIAGTATVIDGSALQPVIGSRTDCAGDRRQLPEPIIHLGRDTSIARLSIVSGSNVAIGEPAHLVEPGENLSAEITNTVIYSTRIAVTFSNSGCDARTARSTLTFTHNVVHGGTTEALGIVNMLTGDAMDSTDRAPAIKAFVAFNRFYQNGVAILAFAGARSTDGATIVLESANNLFVGNQGNILGLGGFGNAPLPAVGNVLRLTSHFDTFGASSGSPSILLAGGRLNPSFPGAPQRNVIEAEITQARFQRNNSGSPAEISIVGAEGGDDNHVEALIRQCAVTTTAGAPAQGVFMIEEELIPGAPPNSARLLGSARAFAETNSGLPVPPEKFFTSR